MDSRIPEVTASLAKTIVKTHGTNTDALLNEIAAGLAYTSIGLAEVNSAASAVIADTSILISAVRLELREAAERGAPVA